MAQQPRRRPGAHISIPIAGQLSPSLSIDASNPAVLKTLTRLSRQSLISLVLDWLNDTNVSLCPPIIARDADDYADDMIPPAESIPELIETYTDLQARKGSKREIVDRIIDGDWRNGLTLLQLAMADFRYMEDHPTSQRWSAYRIVPLKLPKDVEEDGGPPKVDKLSLTVPRFHASMFLKRLRAQLPANIKTYCTIEKHSTLPLLLLRIFVMDTPYNTALAFSSTSDESPSVLDTARTIFVAFPTASPHVFISRPTGGASPSISETKGLRNIIVGGIPGALSRPGMRFKLQSTSLTTRNLDEMCERRGEGRGNAAGGGWGIYADEAKQKKMTPLDMTLPSPPLSADEEPDKPDEGLRGMKRKVAENPVEKAAKRRRKLAQARFGDSAKAGDGKGMERLDIVIEDPFPSRAARRAVEDEQQHDDEEVETANVDDSRRRSRSARANGINLAFEAEAATRAEQNGQDEGQDDDSEDNWRPRVRLTFHGSHIFAGMRQLVEAGVIDGKKMPGWMTGEEGVSIGVVRHGRIRGHKGSGI